MKKQIMNQQNLEIEKGKNTRLALKAILAALLTTTTIIEIFFGTLLNFMLLIGIALVLMKLNVFKSEVR